MKKNFILLISLFILSVCLYAKEIEIKYIRENGKTTTQKFDSEIKTLTLFSSDSVNFKILDIKGLEQFTNIENIEIYMLYYEGDYTFLHDIKSPKSLFLDGARCSSLKFLEKMTSLKEIEISFVTSIDETIDLKNLKNIKKITYQDFYAIRNEGLEDRKIPNFINVQNKPVLDLNNDHIKKISKRNIELLKQYSKIILDQNPICKNKWELRKLKRMNIFINYINSK